MSSSSASSSSSAFVSRKGVDTSSMVENEGNNNGRIAFSASKQKELYSPGSSAVTISNSRLPPSPLVTPPGGRIVQDRLPDGNNFLNAESSCDKSDQKSVSSGSKRGVPHIYHDYNSIPDVIGYVRKKTGGVTQPFPEKLHEMLEAVDGDTRRIVFWLSHGRAFLVQKPKEFTSEIMPK